MASEGDRESGNWDIVFRLLTGSVVRCGFDPENMSTVGQARAFAAHHLSIDPSQIRLISAGRVLGEDTAALSDVGVTESSSSIHVVVRPPTAPQPSQTQSQPHANQQASQPVSQAPQQPAPQAGGLQSDQAPQGPQREGGNYLDYLRAFNINAQHPQGAGGGGGTGPDRVVLENSFPSRLETVISRTRVLDRRLRATTDRPPSQLTNLNNFDAVTRPVQSAAGALFDFSQLLESFQLPLQTLSNGMQEERFLMTSSAAERIGRTSRQEELRGNLLALAEVSTNLAGALESIHYQDNSAPVPGQGGRVNVPMPRPGVLGGMPALSPFVDASAQGGPVSGVGLGTQAAGPLAPSPVALASAFGPSPILAPGAAVRQTTEQNRASMTASAQPVDQNWPQSQENIQRMEELQSTQQHAQQQVRNLQQNQMRQRQVIAAQAQMQRAQLAAQQAEAQLRFAQQAQAQAIHLQAPVNGPAPPPPGPVHGPEQPPSGSSSGTPSSPSQPGGEPQH